MEVLAKGENITLKNAQGANLEKVRVGLGWDMKDGHSPVDVDLSFLPLKGGRYDDGGKVLNQEALCYYGRLDVPGIHHSGDNRTGAGDGDDETGFITFNALSPETTAVLAIANIYGTDANTAKNFGSIQNVKMNVYNNEEAAPSTPTIDLTEDYSGKNAVVVAEFYKKDGVWKYRNVGEGITGQLKEVMHRWE